VDFGDPLWPRSRRGATPRW